MLKQAKLAAVIDLNTVEQRVIKMMENVLLVKVTLAMMDHKTS